MKIVVHGAKGGYNIITPDKNVTGLFDARPDYNKVAAIGQSAYSIHYGANCVIFSKYKIIRDVIGDLRTGNIAFSVIVANNEKLSGADVKALLDKLFDDYCSEYIKNNNLENVREDWTFVNDLTKEYNGKIQQNPDEYDANNYNQGRQDAAFVYYPYTYKDPQTQKETEFDLEDIFNAPYQEEYTPYRQILFISSDLNGKPENSLNALRNSGVELKNIDLKNEYYYLNNYNRSKGVTITASGNPRSDGSKNNSIRAKWKVKIEYSKDDRCYDPIKPEGTISDKNSKIHDYIEIKGNQIIIKYDAFNNPPEKTKTVTFEIKNRNGKDEKGAEIQIDTQPWVKIDEDKSFFRHDFKGEDIIKRYDIYAKKGENFYSDKKTFVPENENSPIELELHEHQIVKFKGKCGGECFSDIKVSIPEKSVNNQKPEVDFVDDEINQPYRVTATFSNNNNYYQGERKFCPNAGDFVEIDLFKQERKQNNKKQGNYDDTLVAKPEKPKSFFSKITPKKWGLIAVGALLLTFGIWTLCHYLGKDKSKEIPLTAQQITAYVEGDSLFTKILDDYNVKWKKQENDFITKSGGGPFGGGETSDSTKWKSTWKPAYESIDRAITKRNLLSSKNFTELRNLRYSEKQQSFKTAIEKIDSNKYEEVGQQLGDVSALTLTQIADSINVILIPKETEKQEQPQEQKKEEKKTEQKKENTQPTKSEQSNPQKTNPVSIDKTSEIIQYIKGCELKKEMLNQYLNNASKNATLKASINLCLKFWTLDGSKDKSYSSFQKELNQDNNLKNSNLKIFVDEMCNQDKPKYLNEISGNSTISTLTQLKNKLK